MSSRFNRLGIAYTGIALLAGCSSSGTVASPPVTNGASVPAHHLAAKTHGFSSGGLAPEPCGRSGVPQITVDGNNLFPADNAPAATTGLSRTKSSVLSVAFTNTGLETSDVKAYVAPAEPSSLRGYASDTTAPAGSRIDAPPSGAAPRPGEIRRNLDINQASPGRQDHVLILVITRKAAGAEANDPRCSAPTQTFESFPLSVS